MSSAYLIAGAGGMLGTALQRVLTERGLDFSAPGEGEFDITDPVAVRHRLAEFAAGLAPGVRGVVVNAAAYTNVEAAEDNDELAYLVNSHGPALLARGAREQELGLVHVSTDFVFDGRKRGAYTEDDDTNPLSVYGASKLAGEIAVAQEYPDAVTARTAWVFGPGGANFPIKIATAARNRPSLAVVNDEFGSPTYTLDLASGLLGLVDAGASGLFHLAGSGSCSRFELASEVLALAGLGEVVLEPVTSGTFPTKAARPLNSVLDCSKAAALGVTMPEWTDSIARFVASGALAV
ncbi:MAG: dTDP-4-dehydrorhamnose reductase [Acidimicrobiales bacterium]|nr:dTDP-4-dehydrorhamnose reductase [Acidimicrobiales bacterium]